MEEAVLRHGILPGRDVYYAASLDDVRKLSAKDQPEGEIAGEMPETKQSKAMCKQFVVCAQWGDFDPQYVKPILIVPMAEMAKTISESLHFHTQVMTNGKSSTRPNEFAETALTALRLNLRPDMDFSYQEVRVAMTLEDAKY